MASEKFIKKSDRRGGGGRGRGRGSGRGRGGSNEGSRGSFQGKNRGGFRGGSSRGGGRGSSRGGHRGKPRHRNFDNNKNPENNNTDETNDNQLEPKFEKITDPNETKSDKPKKQRKRARITQDIENLNEKCTLKTVNQDLIKFFTIKSGHKLSDIEKAEKKLNNDKNLYFIEEGEELTDFLVRAEVNLKNEGSDDQQFHLITISSSAIRAVDLKRIFVPTPETSDENKQNPDEGEPIKKKPKTEGKDTKKFTKSPYKILKLFGKHMKITDQIELIKANSKKKVKYDLAFATIHRLLKLIEAEAIKLDNLILVVDYNFRNKKYWE